MSFVELACGLAKKPVSAILPLSKSLGSPAAQASLIFRLPDELILSILSHVSPDPLHSDHFARRFRVQYGLTINVQERVRFLRSLSMTCKAMRLRLIPWVWECLELFPSKPRIWGLKKVQSLRTVLSALKGDACLAIAVRSMTLNFALKGAHIPFFVKCLESLPNLHTLEIAWSGNPLGSQLRKALEHVKLPQIKTLIMPATAHPLLEHCPEVEDVVCVVMHWNVSSGAFHRSLAFNPGSKVRRLAIPLTPRCDKPSRFATACPKLTELTVIYSSVTEHRVVFAPVGAAAVFEIVTACKTLPDFDTLQIVHFPSALPMPGASTRELYLKQTVSQLKRQRELARGRVRFIKEAAMIRLRQEGEGGTRKKTTVRVIELRSDHPERIVLDSVEVEEYEVQ